MTHSTTPVPSWAIPVGWQQAHVTCFRVFRRRNFMPTIPRGMNHTVETRLPYLFSAWFSIGRSAFAVTH